MLQIGYTRNQTIMNKIRSYEYIFIGLILRYGRQLNSSNTKYDFQDGINSIKNALVKANLKVSAAAIDSIDEDFKEMTEKIKDSSKLGPIISKEIKTRLESLEDTVYAESTLTYIHNIPLRRYQSIYLLETPDKLLNTGVFLKLSDIAKYDFTSACRCIAYGEATASAFHVLRATEDTLKQFYFSSIKTKRLKTPMWGPMTIALRSKKTNKPKENILGALDLVRISYRNPTQHPEAIYDIESAQDLLGLCIDLINKMVITYK